MPAKVPGNLVIIDVTGVYATDSGIFVDDVALLSEVQLLDAELTALAGLTSAANKLPYFTGSGTAALTDLSAFARTILDDADAAAVRTTLSVPSGSGTVSGTNTGDQDLSSYATTAAVAAGYQPLDAELTAIAGLTSAANKLPYFTGLGTAALTDLTAAGRALLDDADSTAMRTTLNLVIGADVQAFNSNLAALAGLTIASDSLTIGTGLATFNQVTFAANKFPAKSSTGGLVAKDISDFGLSLVDDANATAARTTLGLGTAAVGTLDTDVTLSTSGNVPTAGAVKTYADNLLAGLVWKAAVRCATTANITLSGEQAIDGVTTSTSRVLVKNQSTASGNGIYLSSSGAWTRASDADSSAELVNATVFVSEGTVNGDTQWTCTNNATITVGSTSLAFAQVSGAGTYTGGTGITITGNSVAISDAELLALAGLTSAADRLPYFTGSGTADLATFTAFGRTLLDDADATAARATLVLGTSATIDTGTSGATIPLLNGTNQWSAAQRFINSSGILILDTDSSHTLGIIVGSNLTSNRSLTITTGDASRTITLSGDTTLSGTNTGDQTITLTGNVTGSGTGSFATTIAASAVTLAMQANMATASLVYRKTAGTGAPEVNTLATLKTDLGLTGTNSGDQTITLTGNVTGSGTGSFATTIAASAVTLAMQANMATASLVYRKTAGTGAPEVNTLATLKTDLGLTGTNSGDQTITLTGVVTGSGTGSFATSFASIAGLSVLGTAGSGSMAPAALTAGSADFVLRVSTAGTSLAFGTVATGGIADDAVTYAKLQNISATDRLLGRDTAAAGNAEELTVGGGIEFTGSGGIQRSALTGDTTASAGSNSTTVISASDTVAGKIEIAIQSEMETGTDVVRAVVPGRMQYHKGVAKAWVIATISGTTVTVQDSYNVSSITRNGVGDYSINLTTAFSSAYYDISCGVYVNTAGSATLWGLPSNINPPTASVCRVVYVTSGGSVGEVARIDVVMFGDQ